MEDGGRTRPSSLVSFFFFSHLVRKLGHAGGDRKVGGRAEAGGEGEGGGGRVGHLRDEIKKREAGLGRAAEARCVFPRSAASPRFSLPGLPIGQLVRQL